MGYDLAPYFVQIRIKTRNTSQCVSWCCAPSTQPMFRTTGWWTGLHKDSLWPPSSSTSSRWHFLLCALKINKCLFFLCGFTHVWTRTKASIFIFWLRGGWDFSCHVLFGCCHRHKGSCDGRGCSNSQCELSFYYLLQLLPSFAISTRVQSTDPPCWHTGAQGIWGGSDFHLLCVTQHSAAGDTLLLLEISTTSPTDIN